jgi:hypothetical protein
MGLCICSIWGLRVSRLLDHRAVSGSKSDTPTRAKNCEESYSNEQRRSRQRRIHPPSLYELWRGKGDSRQKTGVRRRAIGMMERWGKKPASLKLRRAKVDTRLRPGFRLRKPITTAGQDGGQGRQTKERESHNHKGRNAGREKQCE